MVEEGLIKTSWTDLAQNVQSMVGGGGVTCGTLIVVTSAHGSSTYQASSLDPDMFFRIFSGIYGYLEDGIREKGILYCKR